jgi:hypothetical protein
MLIPKFKAMRPLRNAYDQVGAQSGGNVRRFVLQCNIKVRSYSAFGGTVKIATKTLQWRSFRMVSLVNG